MEGEAVETKRYRGHVTWTVEETIDVTADSRQRAIDLIREAVETENLIRHDIGMELMKLVAVRVLDESDFPRRTVWSIDEKVM